MDITARIDLDIEESQALHCMACESPDVHFSRVRSAFWQDDRLVVVENIPALVCEQCGEQFYDDRTAIRLDILRGTGFPPDAATRTLEVPVFDFGDMPAVMNVS